MPSLGVRHPILMSLNRYEQAVFDYWEKHPEERRHWQAKVVAAAKQAEEAGTIARSLERELWDYWVERAEHVAALRDLQSGGTRRVSLLNLADYVLRLWGPPRKPKNPRPPGEP